MGIERALATSLVGIFLISSSGFAANAGNLAAEDWKLAGLFLIGSAAGMTGGTWLKQWIPARGLELIFGISVIGTAGYVISRNL